MSTKQDPMLSARADLGNATRRGDKAAQDAARVRIADAKLERAIQQALEHVPPLTAERRQELAFMLATGGAR